ncbi:MAG: acylphosphatase [Candidatus Omnitrophica bacterium]|nr:acylphosphatase [Candidatus Omnitrophota bacterium]
MKKAFHAFYSGNVQGVGFRFTVQRIADELKVTGWVRNLSDGRVELVGEADEEKLNSFFSKINEAFSKYIRDTQISWEPATGELSSFSIRF